ncbi:hypothetical protein B0H11DRAFT_2214951 [Mycena galericulata]|nr:hypothetical protein B0H11DRAFT_2214951 [Mycena galericulata]
MRVWNLWRDVVAQKVVLEAASQSKSLPQLDAVTIVQGQELPDPRPDEALTALVIDAESLANLGYSRFLISGQFNGERAMDGVVQQKNRRMWLKKLLCF